MASSSAPAAGGYRRRQGGGDRRGEPTGTGVRRIARELGAGVGTVLRLIDEGAATG